MKVSKETSAKHRDELLKAASRLFRGRGFDKVGIAEIATAAGRARRPRRRDTGVGAEREARRSDVGDQGAGHGARAGVGHDDRVGRDAARHHRRDSPWCSHDG